MVQVLTVIALGVGFPHAAQVAQVAKIVRHRICVKTGKRTRGTVYVLTDPTSRQASPRTSHDDRALAVDHREPAPLRLRHHLREDASKVRTDHGPENMATRRSFAICQLRVVSHANIAAGLREMSCEPFRRPLDLLGLI